MICENQRCPVDVDNFWLLIKHQCLAVLFIKYTCTYFFRTTKSPPTPLKLISCYSVFPFAPATITRTFINFFLWHYDEKNYAKMPIFRQSKQKSHIHRQIAASKLFWVLDWCILTGCISTISSLLFIVFLSLFLNSANSTKRHMFTCNLALDNWYVDSALR